MKAYRILSLLSVLLLAAGCLSPARLQPDERMIPVVTCVLSYPQERQEASVYYSLAAGQDTPEPVTGGALILFDEAEGAEAGRFVPDGKGKWTLDYQPVPGHAYRLTLQVPGQDELVARTRVPEADVIHRGHGGKRMPGGIGEPEDHPLWGHEFLSPDAPCLCISFKDFHSGPVWMYWRVYYPEENLWVDAPVISTNAEEGVDPFNVTGRFSFEDIPDWSLSYFWYHYYLQLDSISSDGEFHYKIQNKSEIQKKSYDYRWKSHRRFLRIKQADSWYHNYEFIDYEDPFILTSYGDSLYHFDRSIYQGDTPPDEAFLPSAQPPDRMTSLVVLAVSAEYDLFLKEALAYQNKENSNDFTFLYDRNNIYSNVQNGLGIFGAKLSYHLPSTAQAGRRNDYQPYIPDILK